MNLKKIWSIYNTIKKRLPETYPRPKLAFFEDEECMLKNQKMRKKRGENIYAVVDPNTWTIHIPLNMTFEYRKKDGEIYSNSVALNKVSDKDIALTILHEIAHLYAGQRYGYNSKQYYDEDYCDNFADRWCKKMINEGLLE